MQRPAAQVLLQDAAQPAPIAEEIERLLRDPAPQQAALASVIAGLGEPGAGAKAAAIIARELGAS